MIRSMQEFMASVWDFGFIEEKLPGKLRFSDIDGMIEKNGRFFVIETKRPGVKIPMGQFLLYRRLIETGLFTVLSVWGFPGEPISAVLFWDGGGFFVQTPVFFSSAEQGREEIAATVKHWLCRVMGEEPDEKTLQYSFLPTPR